MLVKLCNRSREVLAIWPLPLRMGRPPRAPGAPLDVPELVAWEVPGEDRGMRPRLRYFRVDSDSIRDGSDPITPVYIECDEPTLLGRLGA